MSLFVVASPQISAFGASGVYVVAGLSAAPTGTVMSMGWHPFRRWRAMSSLGPYSGDFHKDISHDSDRKIPWPVKSSTRLAWEEPPADVVRAAEPMIPSGMKAR